MRQLVEAERDTSLNGGMAGLGEGEVVVSGFDVRGIDTAAVGEEICDSLSHIWRSDMRRKRTG